MDVDTWQQYKNKAFNMNGFPRTLSFPVDILTSHRTLDVPKNDRIEKSEYLHLVRIAELDYKCTLSTGTSRLYKKAGRCSRGGSNTRAK